MYYPSATKEVLLQEKEALCARYRELCGRHYDLNMSRGKPGTDQLNLSEEMLTAISRNEDCFSESGTDCRNYGLVDGITEAKKLFADILGVLPEEVIVGGNSSLNLMYDTVVRCLLYGVSGGNGPWIRQGKVKFLCPCPGYDRHFGICESLGIEMVNVDMTPTGPDMDQVERLVRDEAVKGIWCTPKYSNPDGITYSDETVRRFAALRPASKDFRIFWDNAYVIHDLYEEGDTLLNILDACKEAGNPDMVYIFTSTSKITYPGSGVSVIASSVTNVNHIKEAMRFQTIGHDKMNMLRHVRYFGSAEGMQAYMKKHAAILRPKFDLVLEAFVSQLLGTGTADWNSPKGGYFISLNVLDGCARRTVELCRGCGIVLTDAGATFPYHKDPRDRNIRIAPSCPSCEELACAVEVLCVCVKLAACEKLLDDRA